MQLIKSSALLLSLAILTGCAVNPTTGERELNRAGIGAAVGAVAGGLVGAMVGNGRGAVAGAALGAAVGGGTGYWLDHTNKKRIEDDLSGTGIDVSTHTDPQTGREVLVLQAPADVTFASGSADMNSDAYMGLARAANSLRTVPSMSVVVVGHTDNRGSEDLNKTLSKARADNVARFLVSVGLPADAVQASGVGFSAPVATNDTAAGRAQNRRVEIRVISQDQKPATAAVQY